MSSTEPAGHLAIGEVLALLREDFPDVTISKIRFLESQGLIQPERTPSGYRKFFDSDIERLRWVLRQQKERFLPLKVIKERLDSGEALDDFDTTPAQARLFAGDADAAADAGDPSHSTPGPTVVEPTRPAGQDADPAQDTEPSGDSEPRDPAAWLAALQENPRRRPTSRPVEPALVLEDDLESAHYGAAELAAAAGVTEAQLAQLIEFGIVRGVAVGGESTFDDAALGAARAASSFLSRGIEPRHLRAYKLAAEREVSLFEQLILPLLRQRNPTARALAADTLAELGEAGAELRSALLRQALRSSLQPR